MSDLRQYFRYRILNRTRYASDLAHVTIRNAFSRKRGSHARPASICALLASDAGSFTSEQQFSPIFYYRKDLRRKYGFVYDHQPLSHVMKMSRSALHRYDLIVLKLSFKTTSAASTWIVSRLHERKGQAKLIYYDGDDDLAIQWPNILPYVDLYVKRHLFRDLRCYQTRFVGKSNLTDFVAREHGVSFDANLIPSSKPVNPRDQHKIYLGANFALDDKIRCLYFNRTRQLPENKKIDIMCRATIPDDWLYHLRKDITPKLHTLSTSYRVLTPETRVPLRRYYEELRQSKICVSPFGYGELCYRDFEAVLCGAMLVKPDMDHVRTHPDIFEAGKTYVPVRWDFDDLEETCHYYLSHDEERERIVRRSYDLLADYFDSSRFVFDFGIMLKTIGL